MSDEESFTAKDAKEVVGLSYRQLHDWESRDAIPSDEKRERKWRKFDSKQLFTLIVCAEIRRLYGIPLEKIRYVRDFMSQEGANRYCQVDVERANLSRRADFLCSHRTAQVTSCQTMKARSRSSR